MKKTLSLAILLLICIIIKAQTPINYTNQSYQTCISNALPNNFQSLKAESDAWYMANKGINFAEESNHAIIIYNHNPAMMKQKLNYIHQNPVQEGIVELAEEYLYSSARDYAGKNGLVKITLI